MVNLPTLAIPVKVYHRYEGNNLHIFDLMAANGQIHTLTPINVSFTIGFICQPIDDEF